MNDFFFLNFLPGSLHKTVYMFVSSFNLITEQQPHVELPHMLAEALLVQLFCLPKQHYIQQTKQLSRLQLLQAVIPASYLPFEMIMLSPKLCGVCIRYLCDINCSAHCEVRCGDAAPFPRSLSIREMYCTAWWKAPPAAYTCSRNFLQAARRSSSFSYKRLGSWKKYLEVVVVGTTGLVMVLDPGDHSSS